MPFQDAVHFFRPVFKNRHFLEREHRSTNRMSRKAPILTVYTAPTEDVIWMYKYKQVQKKETLTNEKVNIVIEKLA